jgi:hypothetical protein
MQTPARTQTGVITETIRVIVDRVTYHFIENREHLQSITK